MVEFNVDGVDFERTRQTTQFDDSMVPCKVLAIAKNHADEDDVKFLVHGCEFRRDKVDKEQDTVLIEFWTLHYHNLYRQLPGNLRNRHYNGQALDTRLSTYKAPLLTWVSLENINCRCLVIEEEPGIHEVLPMNGKQEKNRIMLIRRHCQWANEFTLA